MRKELIEVKDKEPLFLKHCTKKSAWLWLVRFILGSEIMYLEALWSLVLNSHVTSCCWGSIRWNILKERVSHLQKVNCLWQTRKFKELFWCLSFRVPSLEPLCERCSLGCKLLKYLFYLYCSLPWRCEHHPKWCCRIHLKSVSACLHPLWKRREKF